MRFKAVLTNSIRVFCCISVIILDMILCTSCVGASSSDAVPEDASTENRSEPELNIFDVPGENGYEGMISPPEILDIKNTQPTLNVATYITKINDDYFIVDCYHNQIIYHNCLGAPLTEWQVLTNEVHYAHTIATDGTMLLVDDTENNRILVFQNTDAGYAHVQTLEHIGIKPHYVQYDSQRDIFMAWSSITGELYVIKKGIVDSHTGIFPLYIEKVLKIEELYGVYVRSFTLLDGSIYFVSGHNNQKIIKAAVSEDGGALEIEAVYIVPPEIAGMVQLTKIQEYYYITVSTDNQENQDYATIIRCRTLEELAQGRYEDIYERFGVSGGTPYYITEIEGRYYLTHHRTSENIIAFDVKDNELCNVELIY